MSQLNVSKSNGSHVEDDHSSSGNNTNSVHENRSDDLSASSSDNDDYDSDISFNSHSDESKFQTDSQVENISFEESESDNVVSIPNTPCSPTNHAVNSNQTPSYPSERTCEEQNPITPTIGGKLSPLKQPPPPPIASSLVLDDLEPFHMNSISMESDILESQCSFWNLKSKESSSSVKPRLVHDVRLSPEKEIQIENMGSINKATLFSIPLDTLHTIATFLVVDDWRNLGLVSKEASNVCREIFHRIKIHAFKCAVEVAIAWNRREHADAKELAALYISSGVPIYPAPLGHGYHTIHWRMKIETDVMVTSTDDESGPDNESRNNIDSFYLRRNSPAVMTLTYLEEKGMFWKSKTTGIRTELSIDDLHRLKRRFSPRSATPVVQFFDEMHPLGVGDHGVVLPGSQQFQPLSIHSAGDSSSDFETQLHSHREKVVVYCHRHLVDNHYRHKPSVNDEDGNMVSSPISLSTDFFHPIFREDATRDKKPFVCTNSPVSLENNSTTHIYSNTRPMSRRSHRGVVVGVTNRTGPSRQMNEILTTQSSTTQNSFEFFDHDVIADLDIRAYDSRASEYHRYDESKDKASTITSSEERSIITRYEVKLRLLLQESKYREVDECFLDFWDEFFSATATVHFYDQHTPIVRMSKLKNFLSKPYPKAWGTMECEVERIRVKYRIKGVIGRYYSTYEYRLFIRDRRKSQNDEASENETRPRMDTVLMTSKYRGKYYPYQTVTSSDQVKRGANRHYICLPEKDDIDNHFHSVNENKNIEGFGFYHQQVPQSEPRMELCRLQTNHFGTDFQISVPCFDQSIDDERIRGNEIPQCRTEGGSAKKKNLLKKLSDVFKLRKTSEPSTWNKKPISPTFSTRISPSDSSSQSGLEQGRVSASRERDIGAITYTANVLGNRPRVMNVCVPKLCNDNMAPESSVDCWIRDCGGESNMINLLKEQHSGNPSQYQSLMFLQNRPPWWNHELNAFVLNFGGRVSVASVKNFQLCERHDRQNIILQFGRIEGRHAFTCDFTHPLSPMQAFAISISSLQSRFSFA
jgi:hypothetical protein